MQNPTGSAVGTPSSYASNGLHMPQTGASVLIGHDAGGFYALSSICPHQDCDMAGGSGQITASGVTCTCHGSKFSLSGAVTHGPANQGLPAYAMELGCDGQLYVDTNSMVAASQRVPG